MSQPQPTPQSSGSPDRQPRDDGEASTGLIALIVHHSITVLILVLVLGLSIWGYLNFQDTDFFATVDTEQFDARLHPPLERAQAQRIEVSLEVYSLVYDSHPVQLQEVVDAGLLVPADLYYPRGPGSWSYERLGDGYRLEPAVDEDDEG